MCNRAKGARIYDVANPSVKSIIQPDGSLRCSNCGGTQFETRHSTGRKVAVGVATLLASANEVHCVACGARYSRELRDAGMCANCKASLEWGVS